MEILKLAFSGSQSLYIDPAATSALLSSITAILVAVGASFIVFWRKLKKKVDKTLKIDPNKHKEVEEDIVVHDESSAQAEAKSGEKETNANAESNANETKSTDAQEEKKDSKSEPQSTDKK